MLTQDSATPQLIGGDANFYSMYHSFGWNPHNSRGYASSTWIKIPMQTQISLNPIKFPIQSHQIPSNLDMSRILPISSPPRRQISMPWAPWPLWCRLPAADPPTPDTESSAKTHMENAPGNLEKIINIKLGLYCINIVYVYIYILYIYIYIHIVYIYIYCI